MTKQDLRNYRHIRESIRQLDGEIEYWRTKAERSTRPPSMAPSYGGTHDPLPDFMDKIIACEKAQAALTAELCDIESTFAALDGREARLMRAYYVQDKTWEQVAVEMNYSIQHIWSIHGIALEKLKDQSFSE